MNAHDQALVSVLRRLRQNLSAAILCVDEIESLVESLLGAAAVDAGVAGAGPPDGRDRTAPLVSLKTMTVAWSGQRCYLGYTLPLRIMERLSRRPNVYHAIDELVDDIWSSPRSLSAVRSAVSDLRAKLAEAGMDDLAGVIDGTNRGHYGLMLDRLA